MESNRAVSQSWDGWAVVYNSVPVEQQSLVIHASYSDAMTVYGVMYSMGQTGIRIERIVFQHSQSQERRSK
jgi:hypothetical protein